MNKKVITLNESEFHEMIEKMVTKVLNENAHDYWSSAVDRYLMSEKLPKGWSSYVNDDGETVYTDGNFNTYTKDEYGNFVLL